MHLLSWTEVTFSRGTLLQMLLTTSDTDVDTVFFTAQEAQALWKQSSASSDTQT